MPSRRLRRLPPDPAVSSDVKSIAPHGPRESGLQAGADAQRWGCGRRRHATGTAPGKAAAPDASEPEDLSTSAGATAGATDNRGLATGPPGQGDVSMTQRFVTGPTAPPAGPA